MRKTILLPAIACLALTAQAQLRSEFAEAQQQETAPQGFIVPDEIIASVIFAAI